MSFNIPPFLLCDNCLSFYVCMVESQIKLWKKEAYVYMSMSKVTEFISPLVNGIWGFPWSKANNTPASSCSTSYETRSYITHWKVHKTTLKTDPFTFHFSCGFLFASLHLQFVAGFISFIFTCNFHCGFLICIVFFICNDGGFQPPNASPYRTSLLVTHPYTEKESSPHLRW